jgi:hypothetical protein
MSKITFFPIQGSGGGGGSVDSVSATPPITSSGGSNPIISTSMNTNKIIGRSNAGVGVMEEITVGDGLTLSGNVLTNTATPTPSGYYGAWQDNNTQSANANNVGVAMIFRTIDLSNGVSVVTNGTNLTRITFAHTGIYNLQFSSQFQNKSNALQDVTIWLRKNNTNVDGSSGFISVPQRKSVNDYGHIVVSWNYLLNVIGGEFYELIWSTTDYQNVTMEYYSAGNPPPATASVILTVTQQAGIMAGTGLTALNGLTADVQTFATGTSGTDFNISSSGSIHTFNIPTASNLARGLVSILAQTFAGVKTFLSAPILDSLTASRILATNGSKAVQSLDTATYPDLTELSYVKGVTSAIQTQLNSKQATITGGATTIVSSNLTASRGLVSDSSGKVAVSTATSTEMGYLSGVTSAIQTQLNSKISTAKSFMGSLQGSTVTAGATSYGCFNYSTFNASESARIFVVPNDCVMSKFYVRLFSLQPATGSLVFTLRKNSADTTVVVTIAAGSAANTEANSGATSASFLEGDDCSFKVVNNASGTSGNVHNTSIMVTI